MSDKSYKEDSPFHRGEKLAQKQAGVPEKIETFGRRMLQDHLPEQHRAFYAELPFVLLATVDDGGRPWASLVPGEPGFMTSPDIRTLAIAASPLSGDPLHDTLKPGAEVGVLGIQLETRRRNRISGMIGSVRPGGFTIDVGQAYGNCPKYIQTRSVEVVRQNGDGSPETPASRSNRFDARTRQLIERSDTLFIASAYTEEPGAASQGADMSHRGGKPGFVRVEGDRSFAFPDFSGNNLFNTVGNLLLNPKAGFLFVDFEKGDLVYMTGEAQVEWEGEQLRAFAGAERLISFRAEEIIRVDGRLPLRFRFGDFSPTLDRTGHWT